MELVYIDPSFVVVSAVVVVLWLFCFLRGGRNYWKWPRGIRTDDCWLAAQKLATSPSIAVQIWRNKSLGLNNRFTVEFSAQSIERVRDAGDHRPENTPATLVYSSSMRHYRISLIPIYCSTVTNCFFAVLQDFSLVTALSLSLCVGLSISDYQLTVKKKKIYSNQQFNLPIEWFAW